MSVTLASSLLSATVHVCSCGRRFSEWMWARLWCVGLVDGIELRNCSTCHSTRARLMPWVSSAPSDYQPGGLFEFSADTVDEQRRIATDSKTAQVH